MKKITGSMDAVFGPKYLTAVILIWLLVSPAAAETIHLKNGLKVTGRKMEQTDKYIRIDFRGVPIRYYYDEIEEIDGKPAGFPSPAAAPKPKTTIAKMPRETGGMNQEEVAGNVRQKSMSDESPQPFKKKKGAIEEESWKSSQDFNEQEQTTSVNNPSPQKICPFRAPVGPNQALGPMGKAMVLVNISLVLIFLISIGKVYVKAGYPGWAILVPVYNLYIFIKMAGRPGWWLLLCFIPLVGIIINVVLAIDIAKRFGKGWVFGLGLLFLPLIGYPILAFSKAQYSA